MGLQHCPALSLSGQCEPWPGVMARFMARIMARVRVMARVKVMARFRFRSRLYEGQIEIVAALRSVRARARRR